MSRKSQVKASIDAKIKQNGKQEITGPILNGILNSMLDASVIDIIQDGELLPKDENGNVVIPSVSLDGAVRYDVEQTLGEVQKALARKNIGAASDANVIHTTGNEEATGTKVFKSGIKLAGSYVRNMADPVYDMDAANKRYVDNLIGKKMERVELAMIASETPLRITMKGQTTALTFEQIKALVQNTAKFVTLLVDEAYYLIPSLDYYDDAVQFVGTNILTGQAEAVRVMINSSDVVSCYAIELEDSGHKVSSMENIIPYDQYIKYPNVKAVIDYISAHGGGLTPEQEELLNEVPNKADKSYVDSRHVVLEVELGEETEEGQTPILNAEELLEKIQNAPEGASFYIKDGGITAEAAMRLPVVPPGYILGCNVGNDVRQYAFFHDEEQDIYIGFKQVNELAMGEKLTELLVKVGELSDLETTDKTSIVNAINEVKQQGGGDFEELTQIEFDGNAKNLTIVGDVSKYSRILILNMINQAPTTLTSGYISIGIYGQNYANILNINSSKGWYGYDIEISPSLLVGMITYRTQADSWLFSGVQNKTYAPHNVPLNGAPLVFRCNMQSWDNAMSILVFAKRR